VTKVAGEMLATAGKRLVVVNKMQCVSRNCVEIMSGTAMVTMAMHPGIERDLHIGAKIVTAAVATEGTKVVSEQSLGEEVKKEVVVIGNKLKSEALTEVGAAATLASHRTSQTVKKVIEKKGSVLITQLALTAAAVEVARQDVKLEAAAVIGKMLQQMSNPEGKHRVQGLRATGLLRADPVLIREPREYVEVVATAVIGDHETVATKTDCLIVPMGDDKSPL